MAILTITQTTFSPAPSTPKKPPSFMACKDDVAAISIQTAARVYLAKKEWEFLYVQHIEHEILRLQEEARWKAKKARKLKILDGHATTLQTLARGYIVRESYRKSDKQHLSLMESVRKRMETRQRIENLKKQISQVKEARNDNNLDEKDDENNRDEVSVRKVEQLKATQHRLNIKARTLEAVTRPLQEHFKILREEDEKLRKKFGKIESKNESRKYTNETKRELLAEKHKVLQETRDELLSDEMDRIARERSKAQLRLDTLVETASAYASLGRMNERDASAFAEEVARIGQQAHNKAKLFKDSLRSLSMASNHSIDTEAAQMMPSYSKQDSQNSLLSDDGAVSRPTKPRHGRVLRNMLRDRSEKNRSLSPIQRHDGSFSSSSSDDSSSRRQLKGQRYLVKRSLSGEKRENLLLKRDRSKRNLERTPSPQRHESVFIKKDRNRTPSPTKGSGSANNTPVISNKMKFKGITTSVTPKANDKAKVSNTVTPKAGSSTPKSINTPKTSNTQTPKISNKQTPKTTNVTTSESKPMRRTYSEVNTSVMDMKKGLRKVLSERLIVQLDDDVPTSPHGNRLSKLKEELRNECSRKNLRKNSKRSKSKDRNASSSDMKRSTSKTDLKRSTSKTKKDKSSPRKQTKSKSPSRSHSRSHSNSGTIKRSDSNSNSRSNSRSRNGRSNSNSRSRRSSSNDEQPRKTVDRQFSGSGGRLRGKRPSSYRKEDEEDQPTSQPRRHVSLKGAKIEALQKKRQLLRRTESVPGIR